MYIKQKKIKNKKRIEEKEMMMAKKIKELIKLIKKINEIMASLKIPEEILERKVKPFGNASHIILPRKYKGKEATTIINH